MGSPDHRPARRRTAVPGVPGRSRAGTGASGSVRKALGPELIGELERLCGRPTIGLVDVAADIAAVTAAAVTGSLVGHVVGPLLAVVYIGVRQRHLSNLAHECVHQKLLATRRGNRLIGYLLTGMLGEGLRPYRASHAMHHARLCSEQNPRLQSYRAGDTSAAAAPPRRAFGIRVIVRN